MAFGIAPMRFIPAERVVEMNRLEADEVTKRRTHHGITTLARMPSASVSPAAGSDRRPFALAGAVQVLAKRNLLKELPMRQLLSVIRQPGQRQQRQVAVQSYCSSVFISLV